VAVEGCVDAAAAPHQREAGQLPVGADQERVVVRLGPEARERVRREAPVLVRTRPAKVGQVVQVELQQIRDHGLVVVRGGEQIGLHGHTW
jgi:hypothetical protein